MRKASLGNTWAQQQFEYYSSSVCSLTDQSFLLISQFPGGESAYRFFFQGHFFKRKRKWTCWVWRGKTHGAKTETRRTVTSGNLVCVCVCVEVGVGSVVEAWGDREAERDTRAPSGGAEPRQQLAHRWHRGVIGRGLAVGWAVAGPHSLAASHAVPPSLKVVAALGQVCSGSSPPFPLLLAE